MSDNDTKDVVTERTFDAPVSRVWQAWTDPEQMMRWWGPKDFTAPTIQMDFRVGGKYLFCMRGSIGPDAPAQDFWSTGTYEEIVPEERLVYTDSFADAVGNVVSPATYGMPDMPEKLRVTVEFVATEDGKTKMTLTHTGAPAGENADNMLVGWNQSFDKLAQSVVV